MAVLSGLYLGQPQHLEQVNTKQPLRMSVVIIPPSYRFGNGSLEVVESLAGGTSSAGAGSGYMGSSTVLPLSLKMG